MLTSLYHMISIVKSLFSESLASLPGGRSHRSLLMGMLGRLAAQKEIDATMPEIANFFGVSPQAVHKAIRRIADLEARLPALPEIPAGCIMATKKDVDKAILSIALDGHSSIEGIQRILARIYGEELRPSTGYISTLLNKAGAFAEGISRSIPLHGITQGANDEIFDDSDSPVLTGVDADSTYIYLMQGMDDRKGETWQLAMETLKDSGLALKVAISDAGKGLLKGVKAAFPEADIQIDIFHVLRDLGGAVHRFKEGILKGVAACYDLEKAVSKAKRPWRRKARDQKEKLAELQSKIPAMAEDFDAMECLHSWLCELASFSGCDYDEATGLMKWILSEMAAVAGRNSGTWELRKEIARFEDRMPAAMLFLKRLFRDFSRAAAAMGLPGEAFRLLHRRMGARKHSDAHAALEREAMEVIGPERWEEARNAHDEIVGSIKRASSMVENVNSRLRVYMNIKKHVSSNFYSLVQLHLNTKKYRRSRVKSRKGCSPVELLTGETWPELIDLFEERGFWADSNARKVA